MRSPVLTCWLFLRLIWGRIFIPVLYIDTQQKFFPPPRRTVYKKALADYFFRN